MTNEMFCYWLQGFFELREEGKITKEQAAVIKEHLSLTMDKVTTQTASSLGYPTPNLKWAGLGNSDIPQSC